MDKKILQNYFYNILYQLLVVLAPMITCLLYTSLLLLLLETLSCIPVKNSLHFTSKQLGIINQVQK